MEWANFEDFLLRIWKKWGLSLILFNFLDLSSDNVFRSHWALYIILFHLLDLSSENVFRSHWALYIILFHPNTLALR